MNTYVFPLFLLAMPAAIFAQTSIRQDSNDLRIVIAAGLTPVAPRGQHEIVFFNALSTYKIPVELPGGQTDVYRNSRLTHVLQWQTGISRQNRLSAGLDFQFTHLRFESDESASPFNVLSGGTPADGFAVHTLSALGPKVRFTPFPRHYEFTLQGSVLFPTGKREYRTTLDEDRLRISLQSSYITPLPARFYVYAGADIQCKPSNDTRKQTTWLTPLNLYVFNKIVDGRRQDFFIFANLSYVSAFEKEYKGGLRQVNAATYWGVGAQYVISQAWSLSANWQGLLSVDKNTTLNKGSYASFGLGMRYMGKLWR